MTLEKCRARTLELVGRAERLREHFATPDGVKTNATVIKAHVKMAKQIVTDLGKYMREVTKAEKRRVSRAKYREYPVEHTTTTWLRDGAHPKKGVLKSRTVEVKPTKLMVEEYEKFGCAEAMKRERDRQRERARRAAATKQANRRRKENWK